MLKKLHMRDFYFIRNRDRFFIVDDTLLHMKQQGMAESGPFLIIHKRLTVAVQIETAVVAEELLKLLTQLPTSCAESARKLEKNRALYEAEAKVNQERTEAIGKRKAGE